MFKSNDTQNVNQTREMLDLDSFVGGAERDVSSDIEEASSPELANAQPTDSLCSSLYVLHDSQDSVLVPASNPELLEASPVKLDITLSHEQKPDQGAAQSSSSPCSVVYTTNESHPRDGKMRVIPSTSDEETDDEESRQAPNRRKQQVQASPQPPEMNDWTSAVHRTTSTARLAADLTQLDEIFARFLHYCRETIHEIKACELSSKKYWTQNGDPSSRVRAKYKIEKRGNSSKTRKLKDSRDGAKGKSRIGVLR